MFLSGMFLHRCNIHFIYEDSFQHQPDLEELILVANPLEFISSSGFTGPVALKHLSLAQTFLRSLTEVPTDNLCYLETLDVGGSFIRSLEGLDHFHLEEMKMIRLDMNSITNLTAADVKKLGRSTTLEMNLKSNDLLYVEPSAFHSLHVVSLDFSGCFNKMDVSVLLKGLEGIRTNRLYLGSYTDNPSSFITSAALQSFCKIRVNEVNFQMQIFSDLTDESFQCLTGVQKLDLTRTHISSLPWNLSGLSNLTHLLLDENSFEDVCDISAGNFPMLKLLSISRNSKFLLFRTNCLQSLGHLETLRLSHSELLTGSTCCSQQLSGLKKLRHLNLSFNSDMMWSELPFNNTPHLQHLDCSHLRFNLSTNNPFNNLQNLQTLNLSWSETDINVNVHILRGLKNLRVLDLKGNAVQNHVLVNQKIFNPVPLLEILDLSVCGLTGLGDVFKTLTKLLHVDLSKNQLTTLDLSGFYSLKRIQFNFADNKIALVDAGSIEKLGNESSIDLSFNPLLCSCTNYKFIIWIKENINKTKHLQETLCANTNQQLLDVDLQCGFSGRSVGIILAIAGIVSVSIAVIYFVKARNRNYTVL